MTRAKAYGAITQPGPNSKRNRGANDRGYCNADYVRSKGMHGLIYSPVHIQYLLHLGLIDVVASDQDW